MIQKIANFIKYFPKEGFVYLFCVLIHFVSPHLYVHFCTPVSWKGLFMSQFLVISPHCQLIRWAINFSGHVLNNLWVFLISCFVHKIINISNPLCTTK